MFNLAVAYSRGDGTAVNLTEATKWYHRAADMGHTMATWKTWEVIHVAELFVNSQVDDMTLAKKDLEMLAFAD